VFPQAGNNRSKFGSIDDNFLLMGLKSVGSQKDFEAIRDNWLPKKNVNEIKHRIKNLTCRRAPNNVIKQWKFEHQIPLRHDTTEFLHLAQAIKWFGTGGHQQLS
jgi:hypothetical protein